MSSRDSGGEIYVFMAIVLFFLFYVPWWVSIPVGMIFFAMQGEFCD